MTAPSIAYKLLTAEGRSLSTEYGVVLYPPPAADGSPGPWIDVPGNGAYLGRDLDGLLRGGWGPRLDEIEYEEPTGAMDDAHVITARRVRTLRTATPDAWAWVRVACRAARLVLSLVPAGEDRPRLAIEAAERCERERTPEAARAADRARTAAWVAAEAGPAEAAEWSEAATGAAAAAAEWSAAAAAEAAAWAAVPLRFLVEEAWPKESQS